tara:strand:- start:80 stop:412 length:333 start_codon:yes stop_codon:yes gene_type:complete
MKIKALKIDAKLGRVIPVEIESDDIINEIRRMIGADVFTNAGEFGNGRLHIELQDNALLKPIDRMFFAGFYPAPMVGDGLLAAWDEDIDVTAAELQAELSFVPTPDMEQN